MKLIIVFIIVFVAFCVNVSAQTTAFTYQGRLADTTIPQGNGSYRMKFRLFDALTNGNQIGAEQNALVSVNNGTFAVTLDFTETPFLTGQTRFLEIQVGETTLSPRQKLSSVPYAVRALSSGVADNANSLGGVAANQYVLSGAPSINAASQFEISGNRILSNGGDNNLFAGVSSGSSNTSGSENSFFGKDAGLSNSMGSLNSFFGFSAGNANTLGLGNAFFGSNAGNLNTTGSFNSFFGLSAGRNFSSGSNNSIFGRSAGSDITIGTGISLLGSLANTSNALMNATAIGFQAFASQSNSLVLGSINGINLSNVDTNVGIGTTAPSERLDIRVNNGNIIFGGAGCPSGSVAIGLNGAFGNCLNYSIRGNGTDLLINRPTGGEILFRENNGSTQFRVRAGGDVAVNTNGGTVLLGNANCSSGFTGIAFASTFGTCNNYSILGNGTDTIINRPTGGTTFFREGNVNQMTLTPGNVNVTGILNVSQLIRVGNLDGSGGTPLCRNAVNAISACSSSIRYKNNINPFDSGLNLIKHLRPVSFNWKADNASDLGLVAEDVAKVEPLLVTRNDKGEIEGVKYDRIGVVLLNAVKEQQDQIEEQKVVNQNLQTKVEQQQKEINELKQQQKQTDELKQIVCSLKQDAKICKETKK